MIIRSVQLISTNFLSSRRQFKRGSPATAAASTSGRTMVEICPGSLKALRALDADIDRVVREYGVPPGRHQPAVESLSLARFGVLVRIITEQQISRAAGIAIYGRFQELYRCPRSQVTGPTGPLLDIARIAKAEVEEMRSVGLSAQKSKYIQDLAQKVECGTLDLENLERYDCAERRKMLQAVKGIGPWSAECFCLFELGEEDAWPTGDIAVLEGIRRLKKMKTRPGIKEGDQLAMAWKPYRGVAARLMWHIYLVEVRNATPGMSFCADEDKAQVVRKSPSSMNAKSQPSGSTKVQTDGKRAKAIEADGGHTAASPSQPKKSRSSKPVKKTNLISQSFKVRKSARLTRMNKNLTVPDAPLES